MAYYTRKDTAFIGQTAETLLTIEANMKKSLGETWRPESLESQIRSINNTERYSDHQKMLWIAAYHTAAFQREQGWRPNDLETVSDFQRYIGTYYDDVKEELMQKMSSDLATKVTIDLGIEDADTIDKIHAAAESHIYGDY